MSNLIIKFRSSTHCLYNIRCLSITAMFVALSVALTLSGLSIKISPELRISFNFLSYAAIAVLFGPVVSMVAGACIDILGYFAGNFTMGGYFIGYTLTAILSGLIYGIFLYNPQIKKQSKANKIICVVLCKTFINLFCNIFLNTFWLTQFYGKTISAILPLRIAKNIILLPFECIILYFAVEIFLKLKTHYISNIQSK